MGLDTFFYLKTTDERQIILANLNNEDTEKEVCYWRKEYALTDWWANRLNAQNCEDCEASEEDIRDFIEFLKNYQDDENEWRDKEQQSDFIKEQIKLFTDLLEKTDWTKNKLIFHLWY